MLFHYLTAEKGKEKIEVANALAADILVIKGRVLPPAVLEHVTRLPDERRSLGESLTKRQSRHRREVGQGLKR